jgi:hypothetical protein
MPEKLFKFSLPVRYFLKGGAKSVQLQHLGFYAAEKITAVCVCKKFKPLYFYQSLNGLIGFTRH